MTSIAVPRCATALHGRVPAHRPTRLAAALLLAVGLVATTGWSSGAVAQSSDAFVRTEKTENAEVVENWQQGYLQATGIGTSDPMDNQVQAKAMALQAARVVAQARLVELIEGVTLRSKIVVENAAVGKQLIASEAKGTIEGAVTVDKSVKWVSSNDYGSGEKIPEAKVTLRVCMQNFAKACQQHGGGGAGLYQQMQPIVDKAQAAREQRAQNQGGQQTGNQQTGSQQTGSQQTGTGSGTGATTGSGSATGTSGNVQQASAVTGNLAETAKNASGIVLNLRGAFRYNPGLAPVIQAENGKVVYDKGMISNVAYAKNGPVQYAATVQQAKSIEVTGGSPYVVNVQNVTQDGALVISNEDAAVIRAANGHSDLLKQARIAVAQRG